MPRISAALAPVGPRKYGTHFRTEVLVRLATWSAAVAVACTGCDDATRTRGPTEPQRRAVTPILSARAHHPGELATGPDFSMSVEAVRACPPVPGFAPAGGAEKLGVEVVIEGNSERQVPVNPFYASLSDSDDERYEMTFHGCSPELVPTRVTRGEKARGWITFEIPKTARGLELRYAPKIIDADRQEARFMVKR